MWIPDNTFIFPACGPRNLRFQLKWLYRWRWLAYSEVQGGAFCKFCALFSSFGGIGDQPLGQLCSLKFNNWKCAIEKFSNHEICQYHKNSIATVENLSKIASKKQLPIDLQLDNKARRQVLENRKNIVPIIETIFLCGRQCLALRGHRDSGPISVDEEPEENDGNFRSLLRFRSKTDNDLKQALTSSNRNAQYLSPLIQNEIIDICNNLILKELVKKVNASVCFAVIADESTDIAGVEQLSLCVRFIDVDEFIVNETFLQFVPVVDVTGKGLATTIIDNLRFFGIDINKMRGQGYDGAESMSAMYNGVQAHIREIIPTALFVHCAAHSLNLAVSNACDIASIRNCMGTLGKVYDFLTPRKGKLY